jgi:hypothetical protein
LEETAYTRAAASAANVSPDEGIQTFVLQPTWHLNPSGPRYFWALVRWLIHSRILVGVTLSLVL